MKQKTKNNLLPKWVTHRVGINFGERHAQMLKELVAQAKSQNPRSNITSVMEEALENLHDIKCTNV